jgi:hypothetical protein
MVAVTPLEPLYESLPVLDPMKLGPQELTPPIARPISEENCRKYAALRVPTAEVLQNELAVPKIIQTSTRTFRGIVPPADDDSLLQEIRTHAAAEARNRAVSDALAAYFQLADVTARSEIIRLSLDTLEEARRLAIDAKARGAIVELDELDRQRASAISVLGQTELGMKLLDVELRRRLNLKPVAKEVLRPTGDFRLNPEPINLDVAMSRALETRPDLLALRTLYLRLAPENLNVVRDYLRALPTTSGLIGFGPRLPAARKAMTRQAEQLMSLFNTAAMMEIEVRRQQLFTLIAERERSAADEVRAAALVLEEQTRQVGVARWRAEQLIKRSDDLSREKGAYIALPATVEAVRARGEVITAVMNWHQARVRLLAAQGLLASEPAPDLSP